MEERAILTPTCRNVAPRRSIYNSELYIDSFANLVRKYFDNLYCSYSILLYVIYTYTMLKISGLSENICNIIISIEKFYFASIFTILFTSFHKLVV